MSRFLLLFLTIIAPAFTQTALADATFTYETQTALAQVWHSRYIKSEEPKFSRQSLDQITLRVQASPRVNRWDLNNRILVATVNKPLIFEQKENSYWLYNMENYISLDEKYSKKVYKKSNLPFPPQEISNFETISQGNAFVAGVPCNIIEFRSTKESFIFYFAPEFQWAISGFDPAIFGEYLFPWSSYGVGQDITKFFYQKIWRGLKKNMGLPLKIIWRERTFEKNSRPGETFYEHIWQSSIEAKQISFEPHKKTIGEINPGTTWLNANSILETHLRE